MSEFEMQMAMSAIQEAGEAVSRAALEVQLTLTSPHILMRPKVYPDGGQWCALYGRDIQEGVAGFGNTPLGACLDFDRNWNSQTLKVSP